MKFSKFNLVRAIVAYATNANSQQLMAEGVERLILKKLDGWHHYKVATAVNELLANDAGGVLTDGYELGLMFEKWTMHMAYP